MAETKYAFLELFGHNTLGICVVREVQQYGATFCEASPLDADGKPGRPQLVAGSAIYRVQPVDEETAMSVAKRRLGYLPALPAQAEEGRPVDAEWDDREDDQPLPDRIAAARKNVEECEAALREALGRSSLYDHEQEMLENAEAHLQELLDEEAAAASSQPLDPPAYERDPVPAASESSPLLP